MQITLRNTSAVAVIDTKGAELRSFQDGFATEYMWQANPEYWARTSPFLFPIVGNLRENKTYIAGKEYEIPKHGILRDAEFRVVYQSEQKAIFSYLSNEQDFKVFPFHFHIQISYTLDGCALEIRYDVYNMEEDKDMLYCIGAHPAFRIPVSEDESFEQYCIEFEKPITASAPVYDLEKLEWNQKNRKLLFNQSKRLMLRYDLFDQDAIHLDTVHPERITVSSILTGRGVQIDCTGFETVAFWTPIKKQAPFLCVEPWAGSAVYSDEGNDFEKKPHLQILAPDQKKTYTMTIQML